jgi:hypothetical protein
MRNLLFQKVLQEPQANLEGEKEEKTTKGEAVVVATNGKGGKIQ